MSLRQGVEPAGNRAAPWDGARCPGCRSAMTLRRDCREAKPKTPFCAACMPSAWADWGWPDPYQVPPFYAAQAFIPAAWRHDATMG